MTERKKKRETIEIDGQRYAVMPISEWFAHDGQVVRRGDLLEVMNLYQYQLRYHRPSSRVKRAVKRVLNFLLPGLELEVEEPKTWIKVPLERV